MLELQSPPKLGQLLLLMRWLQHQIHPKWVRLKLILHQIHQKLVVLCWLLRLLQILLMLVPLLLLLSCQIHQKLAPMLLLLGWAPLLLLFLFQIHRKQVGLRLLLHQFRHRILQMLGELLMLLWWILHQILQSRILQLGLLLAGLQV